MEKVKMVGLTGGIGSGKSFVSKIFRGMGIPVYDADKEAKRLMREDKDLKRKIKQLLGRESYHRNGWPNRKKIAEIIFFDKEKLVAINGVVHPAVAEDFARWHDIQSSPYTIEESALIVQNGAYKMMDDLIVVTAPQEIRIRRVMRRDRVSREKVLARIKNQLPESELIKVADYVIDNSGTVPLLEQIWDIHRQILS